MREKMLLPGHKTIRTMTSINAIKAPLFVSSDLLSYFVHAERRRVFRDEIEEEILSLAPEFDIKPEYKTYDDKVKQLEDEADKTITWIHLLNYQSKLQNINSMRNLNTLKNGKNRYKYSEFYTIGFTPIFKSTHVMSARLAELNSYLKNHLNIYKAECQAPVPIAEFFKLYARKASFAQPKQNNELKKMREGVRVFNGNLSANLVIQIVVNNDKEGEEDPTKAAAPPVYNEINWSYLQTWPASYNYAQQAVQTIKINDMTTIDAFFDYVLTLNWHKNLVVSDENSTRSDDTLIAIVGNRDPLTSNKLKFKMIPADKVLEIHEK
jgi:hypothetical protein